MLSALDGNRPRRHGTESFRKLLGQSLNEFTAVMPYTRRLSSSGRRAPRTECTRVHSAGRIRPAGTFSLSCCPYRYVLPWRSTRKWSVPKPWPGRPVPGHLHRRRTTNMRAKVCCCLPPTHSPILLAARAPSCVVSPALALMNSINWMDTSALAASPSFIVARAAVQPPPGRPCPKVEPRGHLFPPR